MPGDELDELDELLSRRAAELDVPGAALGVVHAGREHTAATGVTSAVAPVPVDAGTLFMIGSVTKPVTATALLSLAESGRLDLDAPLRSVLPDVPAAGGLTARHLLTHTGGLEGDVPDDEDWAEDALARHVRAYAPPARPGAEFSYSNAGLRLAGRVLEVLTGEPYDLAVRRLVLDPLGMRDSVFLPWRAHARRRAVGHLPTGEVAGTWGLGRSGLPSGGLLCPITDLLRFARFHLDGTSAGSPPIKDATRAAMRDAQRAAAPPYDEVGLSWLLVRTHGVRAVTHQGNINGVQVATLLLLPEHGLAVAGVANAGSGRRLLSDLTDHCLRRLLALRPDPPPALRTLGDADLAEYRGRYDAGALCFELTAEDGGLRATVSLNIDPGDEAVALPPPASLAFCGPDEVALRDGTRYGRFQRTDGEITAFLCAGRSFTRRADGRRPAAPPAR